jgi:phosphatidate cytidylyltransferase
MKNLLIRAGTAFIFVLIMCSCILWNVWSYAAIMLLILLGTLREFYNITKDKRQILSPFSEKKSLRTLLISSGILFFFSFMLHGALGQLPLGSSQEATLLRMLLERKFQFVDIAIFFPILLFILFGQELYSKASMPFTHIGWNLIAAVYIVLPVLLANEIYFTYSKYVFMAIIVLIWLNDSMAYGSGMLFGRTKLFERLSPKKTWEGFIGGGLVTAAIAFFVFPLIPIAELHVFSQVQWAVLAIVCTLAATFGDLVESMMKRSLGIKDSGNFMPGHGGFLDRFDAFFYAMPFAAITLWLMAQYTQFMMLVEIIK